MADKFISSDFMKVLQAVKASTMKNTHVAEICRVNGIATTGQEAIVTYLCESINDQNFAIKAYGLYNLEIGTGDIVIVLFCDSDFRQNYRRQLLHQESQPITNEETHQTTNGVIVGILYKEIYDGTN